MAAKYKTLSAYWRRLLSLGDGGAVFGDIPMRFERGLSGPNGVFASDGRAFPHYWPVLGEMEMMGVEEWDQRVHRAYERMLEEQRGLGICGGDRTHPTDYVPCVLPAANWETLERGLAQRMLARNEWLRRLEAGTDEVVPGE